MYSPSQAPRVRRTRTEAVTLVVASADQAAFASRSVAGVAARSNIYGCNDPGTRLAQNLPYGRHRCARPARRELQYPAWRVRGDYGPVGVGQIDADEPAGLPRHTNRGPVYP